MRDVGTHRAAVSGSRRQPTLTPALEQEIAALRLSREGFGGERRRPSDGQTGSRGRTGLAVKWKYNHTSDPVGIQRLLSAEADLHACSHVRDS